MIDDPESLEPSGQYDVDVVVRGDDFQFASELRIRPDAITLRVKGETQGGNPSHLPISHISQLRATNTRNTFILRGLSLDRGHWQSLQSHTQKRSYFEREYSVREVFHYPTGTISRSEVEISLVKLIFSRGKEWLDVTEIQRNILSHYSNRNSAETAAPEDIEFSVAVSPNLTMALAYQIERGYSLPEFRSELTFPPAICLAFNDPASAASVSDHIRRTAALIGFIWGRRPGISRVSLSSNASFKSGSYLCPSIQFTSARESASLFPFRLKEPNNPQHLDWAAVFQSYFQLSDKERVRFEKYMHYQSLAGSEDRFLGFFRLLEGIASKEGTFVDSTRLAELSRRMKPFLRRYFGNPKGSDNLLRQLPRLNHSKYNTEACILAYISVLPNALREKLNLTATEVKQLCKLRNDLVHGNDVSASNDDVAMYSQLTDLLLIPALARTIGIPTLMATEYLPRHEGFASLVSRPQS